MTKTTEKRVHEGLSIKRFREMSGIKQEALAWELGYLAARERNQKKVSLMEAREQVNAALLARVSEILKIPVEAFQNFDDENAVNVIASTFNDSAVANTFNKGAQANVHCTFNPLDKMVELYERMLAQQQEMIEKLGRLMDKK